MFGRPGILGGFVLGNAVTIVSKEVGSRVEEDATVSLVVLM